MPLDYKTQSLKLQIAKVAQIFPPLSGIRFVRCTGTNDWIHREMWIFQLENLIIDLEILMFPILLLGVSKLIELLVFSFDSPTFLGLFPRLCLHSHHTKKISAGRGQTNSYD
mmetsp:Transcript_4498/g.12519  ORF Transcript_4498/g.12519 Transcript_4498/m.12519 type:complete len:112 (-) Transcript_4498:1507-1842(-)